MPIGSLPGLRGTRGFTYLWLLFVIAAGGAAMSTLGPPWRMAMQREQEIESMHRGREIADAIGAWRRASPAAESSAAGPAELQDLLEDRRGPRLKRHLRRLYVDPLTGSPDWVLVRDGSGAIIALHSAATRAAIVREDIEPRPDGSAPPVSARIYRPVALPGPGASTPA